VEPRFVARRLNAGTYRSSPVGAPRGVLSRDMLRVLAILALAACTNTADDSDGKIVSASVEVDGTAFMVKIDATLTGGDYVDGRPVWTSQFGNTLHDTMNFDTLSLSAGDQVWHDGVVIHFIDTRTVAPAPVVARCGATVGLTAIVGVEDDAGIGHSTQATSDVTIDCR